MIPPSRFYELYNAVNLHFKGAGYDCFKYNFKTRVKPESLTTHKARYFFEKMAKTFNSDEAAVDFLVGNIVFGEKWIGKFTKANENKWLWYKQSIDYRFSEDLKIHWAKKYISIKELVQKMMVDGDYVHIQFFIVLNHILNNKLMDKLDVDFADDVLYENFKEKVLTISPFVVRCVQSESKKKLFDILKTQST
jgi:hypothetical protein